MDSCETETDGYAGRDVGDSVGGAVDHVGGPRLVVVAAAVGRTRHLAVAGVELAAVAQGEAVRLVGAQKVSSAGLHQGHVGLLAAVRQPAVDGLEVHDARMLAQVIGRVDALHPLHVAVAAERISADVKFRKRAAVGRRRDAQRVLVQIGDVVGVQVDAGQIVLPEESVRLHLLGGIELFLKFCRHFHTKFN